MGEHKKIGYCSVDSGELVIVDPCYIKGSYNIKKTITDSGLGCVLKGFGGDGQYPVFVEKDESGLVTAVSVRFDNSDYERFIGAGLEMAQNTAMQALLERWVAKLETGPTMVIDSHSFSTLRDVYQDTKTLLKEAKEVRDE